MVPSLYKRYSSLASLGLIQALRLQIDYIAYNPIGGEAGRCLSV